MAFVVENLIFFYRYVTYISLESSDSRGCIVCNKSDIVTEKSIEFESNPVVIFGTTIVVISTSNLVRTYLIKTYLIIVFIRDRA